jgi:exodeoxyribonuclease VII small subunit
MTTPNPDPVSFESALEQLEQVVHDLEDGQLGLDEALRRYEEGIALLQQCRSRLEVVEQRILVLTKPEPDGEPTLQPFKHEATARSGNPRRLRGEG